MRALFKKEINTFFSHANGSIIIVTFLVTNSLLLWLISNEYNILDSGYAQLNGLFSLSPLLFMVFIPALCMRLFSEEINNGTIEILKTLPISDNTLVFSKYLSALAISWIAILPTIIYYISIYLLSEELGNVDSAGILGSYIGLFLLSALFVAIGVFASSSTKNQITSFLVAILIISMFYFGFDLIANEIQNGFIQLCISYIGIDYHYTALSKGVIDFRDVVYFVSLSLVFIQLTIYNINRKRK